MVSPEEQALTRTYSILVDSLEYCAVSVTGSLFAKEMIPTELRKKVFNGSAVDGVIDCLIGRIKINPEEFVDVVEILMRYPTLGTAVKKLKEQYAECGGTLPLPEPAKPLPPAPPPPEKHEYEFSVWLAVGVGVIAIAVAFYYVSPLLFHLLHNLEPKEPQQASTRSVLIALAQKFPPATESVSGSGIQYEYFTEKPSHAVKLNLSAQEFTSTVNDLSESHGFNEQLKDSILDSVYYGRENMEVFQKSQFPRGGLSTVIYMRIVAMKREDGTMDLAYAIHRADFKIQSEIIYHEDVNRFLWFVITVDRWEERRERTLSESDKQYLTEFVEARALAGFSNTMYHFIVALN